MARMILPLLLMVLSGAACATTLVPADVIDGYRNCSWHDNGDGTSTLTVDVNFKRNLSYWAESAPDWWDSRAFVMYAYDGNGKPNAKPMLFWGHIYLNDVRDWTAIANYGYREFRGNSGDWLNKNPFVAHVVFTIQNEYIDAWPAISLQAANWSYSGTTRVEKTGAVYLYRGVSTGSCPNVDPVTPPPPPPPPTTINVSTPDWDLGELPRGNGTKTLSNSMDQLCFTYSGSAVSGKRFVIHATNANGRVNDRYRLRNVDDASQEVPYNVKLDSVQGTVNLPNFGEVGVLFNSSGRTCFVPTFTTTVAPNTKEGTYGDVLTFTIRTKS